MVLGSFLFILVFAWAVCVRAVSTTAMLLEGRACVDAVDSFGGSAVLQAAIWGHLDTMLLLLQHGADANLATARGLTPMHHAARRGHLSCVQALADHGARATAECALGSTPLMTAAHGGQVEALTCLLEVLKRSELLGQNIDAANHQGFTALHIAALCSNPALVTALLEAGADPQLRTCKNDTALDLARRHRRLAHVKDVLERHAAMRVQLAEEEAELAFFASIA